MLFLLSEGVPPLVVYQYVLSVARKVLIKLTKDERLILATSRSIMSRRRSASRTFSTALLNPTM